MLQKISLSLVLALSAVASASAQQIQWVDDFAVARQTAAQQSKLILLHFYKDACPPCERVERSVFPAPEVAEAIGRSYVPMKIYGPQAAELVKRYRIEAYPTDVVVNAAGLEVFRCTSPPDAANYVLMLNGTAAQAGAAGARTTGSYQPGSTATTFPADLAGAAAANVQNYAQQAQGYVNQGQQTAQNYTNQAQGQVNNYANQAQNQIQNYAGQAQNYAQNYLGQANGAVNKATDSIAAATTIPSQLPERRSVYGGGDAAYAAVAQSSPQPPTVNGAVGQTPQAPVVRDQYGPQYTAQSDPQQQPPASGGQYNPAASGGQYNPAANGGGYQPNTVVNYGPPAQQQPQQAAPPGPQWQTNPYIGQQPPQQPAQQQVAQQQPPQQPVQRAAASGPPPLSLDGYCPVFLVEKGKWKKSDPRWGAIHRGRTYLFSGEEEQKKFLADPDKYSPILAGFDPVRFAETGELIDGKRSHGLLYESQIFLFADEGSLDRFTKAAKRYAGTARQAMAQSDGSVRR